jgi:hypothetical protein
MVRVNGKLIRKKLYLIIDTETFNGFEEPYCYDIGFAVIDNTGKLYAKYSFVVHDTFIGMAEQAATAYYANKFPQYHEDIRTGKRILASFATIKDVANAVLEKWDISDVVAHNANFDCLSTNTTARLFGYSSFFKRHVEWWDTLQMVADTIAQQKTYITWCKVNNYMTKHKNPRPQMKAEVVYRYISGKKDFIESHTGLEDVMIEKDIFVHCMRQHKKMRHSFYVYR